MMDSKIKKYCPFIVLILTAFTVFTYLYTIAHNTFMESNWPDVGYLAIVTLAVSTAYYTVFSFGHKTAHGRTIIFFYTGLAFWWIGEYTWIILNAYGIEPFPSAADFFYITGYIPFILGYFNEALILWHPKNNFLKYLLVILSTFLFLIISLSVFMYLLMPEGDGNFISIISGMTSIAHAVALAIIIMMLYIYRGGKLISPWKYLLASGILFLVGDMSYASFAELYARDQTAMLMIDFIILAGYLTFTLGLCKWSELIDTEVERVKIKLQRHGRNS